MSTRFIGGLRVSQLQVTYPLVELRATTDALTFSLRFGLGRVGPRSITGPWVASREEVANIRPIASAVLQLMRIEFHLVDGRIWTFGSLKPHEVLPCLRQLGYPVRITTKDP